MAGRDLRTITHRRGILHVETRLGIVNIHAGLADASGREVTAIEIIPDAYAGEPRVIRRGPANVRLVRTKGARHGR